MTTKPLFSSKGGQKPPSLKKWFRYQSYNFFSLVEKGLNLQTFRTVVMISFIELDLLNTTTRLRATHLFKSVERDEKNMREEKVVRKKAGSTRSPHIRKPLSKLRSLYKRKLLDVITRSHFQYYSCR